MIKILIADDHPIVRQGFKQVLSDTPDLVVADEAGNGQEVLSLVSKKDYDVILLDISMPGKNGLEVLKELKVVSPKTPVLILSIYPEEQYAIRALKAGASVSRGGEVRQFVSGGEDRLPARRRFGEGPARNALRPGVPDPAHDRFREDRLRHCRGDVPQRQDGEHLPLPDHR
jgi:CheY-like chemotaxis protein